MQHARPGRRIFLGNAAGLLLALPAWAAQTLAAPTGKVILTVTGHLTVANDNGAASFDLAQLQALPVTQIVTRTPWFSQPRHFTGVLLRDLLATLGAPMAAIHAGALNDYQVDIPNEDATRHDAMVAYLLDDKPMTVREKGPLVVIYPFDEHAELRNAVHYSRAIWQLRTLELK